MLNRIGNTLPSLDFHRGRFIFITRKIIFHLVIGCVIIEVYIFLGIIYFIENPVPEPFGFIHREIVFNRFIIVGEIHVVIITEKPVEPGIEFMIYYKEVITDFSFCRGINSFPFISDFYKEINCLAYCFMGEIFIYFQEIDFFKYVHEGIS